MRMAIGLQLGLQFLDVGIGLAFGGSICRLIPQSVSFGMDPRADLLGPLHAGCRRRQCRVGHAQFGVCTRLLCGRIG